VKKKVDFDQALTMKKQGIKIPCLTTTRVCDLIEWILENKSSNDHLDIFYNNQTWLAELTDGEYALYHKGCAIELIDALVDLLNAMKNGGVK